MDGVGCSGRRRRPTRIGRSKSSADTGTTSAADNEAKDRIFYLVEVNFLFVNGKPNQSVCSSVHPSIPQLASADRQTLRQIDGYIWVDRQTG